jgi:flagellar hook-associated protein 1 FlgK
VQAYDHVRLRDQFADNQFRTATSTLGQYEARTEMLEPLDTLVDEPDGTGLSKLLQEFWSSWQGLTQQPDSAASREAVSRAGEALGLGLNEMSAQLTALENEADQRISLHVTRVNDIATQINTLNQEVAELVQVGLTPNDLLDERDRLVDELAEYANVSVTQPAGGLRISVAIGAELLVDSVTDTTQTLAVDAAGAATLSGNATTISDGRLRGLIDMRETVIPGYRTTLDTLAADIVAEVNAQHQVGFGLDGVSGRDFFDPAGTTSATIALDAAVIASTDVIAASDLAANVPGGGANAIAIAQVQFDTHAIGAQTTTIDGYHALWIAQVGIDTDRSTRMAQVQQAVLDGAIQRRDKVAGVNLDEEVTDMIRFQQAYNAAARMMTTLDEALDVIVNRMGIVGR